MLVGVPNARWWGSDLVHINGTGSGLLARLTRALGMRVMLAHHGTDYDRTRWGWAAEAALSIGESWGVAAADHGDDRALAVLARSGDRIRFLSTQARAALRHFKSRRRRSSCPCFMKAYLSRRWEPRGAPMLLSHIGPNHGIGLPAANFLRVIALMPSLGRWRDRPQTTPTAAMRYATVSIGTQLPGRSRPSTGGRIGAPRGTRMVGKHIRGTEGELGAPPRPRILLVINSLAGGGAERVMLALIAASADMRDRYDFSLVLLDREPFAYRPPAWVTVHQLDGRFSLPRSLLTFLRLVRRERPDATLSFLTRSNVVTVVAAKLFGHRAIISERANTSAHFAADASGVHAKRLVRLLYPRADAVIAVSHGISDDLRSNFGVRENRLRVIANPVDGDAIRAAATEPPALSPKRPFLVALSRLTPTKNVLLLVEALGKARVDLDLLILGQGPERARIEKRAATLNLSDRVVFGGFQPNPHAIMARARAYVSASNGEGFPNGMVEALALGLPVVATNCASGPSEILAGKRREEVKGLTVARYGVLTPPDDADALARGIELASEHQLHARLSTEGPRRAAEYGPGRAKAAYWAEIERLLAGGR